ncbi:MAG: hypothetical protein C0425_05005 [Chlorobiaceae bacterium]|nr:hypothetical protein [Chlorobiaceae bacterium]MBA4309676.1 hypothetical protein [Chlorobiaceae bacterium]
MTKKEKIISFGILLVLLISVGFFTLFSIVEEEPIKISSVEINSISLLPEEDYLQFIKLETIKDDSKNKLAEIRKRILVHPYVENVKVELSVDNKIIIEIKEKNIVASLLVNEKIYLLSEKYELLPSLMNLQNSDYPLITNSELTEVNLNEYYSIPELKKAFRIIESIKIVDENLLKKLSEVNLRKGKDIVLNFTGWNAIVIIGKNNIEEKIIYLSHARTTNEIKEILNYSDYIDLRYKESIYFGKNMNTGNL